MITNVVDVDAEKCKGETPDHYYLHYDDSGSLAGIRWKYGSEKAIRLSRAAKEVGACWDHESRYWIFPSGNIQAFLAESRKTHPDWPIVTNAGTRDSLNNLTYTVIEGERHAALFIPLPLPALGSYPFSSSRLIKATINRNEWLIVAGVNDTVSRISSVLGNQGARPAASNKMGKIINTQSKIQVKVTGWAVEIKCDLNNPFHYLAKPYQQYKWIGAYPSGVKTPIPWDGYIYITRKSWPEWKERLINAGLDWEGDSADDELRSSLKAVFETIPGWSSPASNGLILHDYQRRGIEFCASRGMRAMIGDEMGVGKTAQAIASAEAAQAKQILIVCPANARYVWEREVKGWGSGGEIHHTKTNTLLHLPPCRWRIVTYDQLITKAAGWEIEDSSDEASIRRAVPSLDIPKGKQYPKKIKLDQYCSSTPLFVQLYKRIKWMKNMNRLKTDFIEKLIKSSHDFLIVDEAHRAKNMSAKRTKAIKRLSMHAPQTLLLTGTPLRSNEHEAAALLSLLDSEAGQHLSRSRGYSIDDVRDYLSYLMIRRTKQEVLPELPEKTRQRIDIDRLDQDTMEDYEKAIGYAQQLHAASDVDPECRQKIQVAIEKARNLLGLAKVRGGEVSDIVEEVVDNKGCVVVFVAHHQVSDTLNQQIVEKGLKVAVLDGRTSQSKRAEIVDEFQNGGLDCLIAGINAAGESITLTRSDTVIFVELDWVPASLQQAEDRIHRIGQKSNCQIIHLIAMEAKLDEYMIEVLESKLKRIDQVLQEGQGSLIGETEQVRKVVFERILSTSGK